MIYTPKKRQWINAFYFDGKFDKPEINSLGLKSAGHFSGFCRACSASLSKHAITSDNANLICPGQYIIYSGADIINVMSKEAFEEIYRPICEEE